MVPPTFKSHLSEVYESSSHVHQALAHFSQNHGVEAVQPLIPEITFLFEHLEETISAKDVTRVEKSLKHVLGQIDGLREQRIQLGLKFDTDFSNIIEQWRMESGVLEKHVAQLKEEVGVLAVSIKNREFDLENLQATTRQNDVVTDDAPFEEVLKIVEDIKTDISRKETYLKEAHQELDASVVDLQQAINAVDVTKEMNRSLRLANAKLREEKDDQLAVQRKLQVQILLTEKQLDRTNRKDTSLSSIQAVLGDAGSGSLDGKYC